MKIILGNKTAENSAEHLTTWRDEMMICESGYADYLIEKIGASKAQSASEFYDYHFREEACCAARDLQDDYDLGIALATDGLWLGYIFSCYVSFQIVAVDMKRRGFGATWKPIDEFAVTGKKVIVFDNDVVTGRTVRRALRELLSLGAESIDLLLVYGHTELSPENYEKWKHFLRKEHRFLGSNWGNICIDTMCQIPEGFRRVMSLEKDF